MRLRRQWIAILECLLVLTVFVLMGMGMEACHFLVYPEGHGG